MVGEKIKAIRMEKGITAKDLAEKSDVTPGYISQIERNLISPSLSVLMRIAEALSIPLVSLFSQEEQEEVTVIPKDNRSRISIWNISSSRRTAGKKIHARRWKCSVSGWGQKAGAVPLCSIMKRQANVRLC